MKNIKLGSIIMILWSDGLHEIRIVDEINKISDDYTEYWNVGPFNGRGFFGNIGSFFQDKVRIICE